MLYTAESLTERFGHQGAALLNASNRLAEVQGEPHEARALAINGLYRAVWLYAVAAAQTNGRVARSPVRHRALLRFCTVANYFVSSMPGYWSDTTHPVRNTLFAAGMTIPEEDAVIGALREAYRETGVVLPLQRVAPESERAISDRTRSDILDTDLHGFHYGAHLLPVDPAAWSRIIAPFHEAVLAAA